jgi:hypothetical protein
MRNLKDKLYVVIIAIGLLLVVGAFMSFPWLLLLPVAIIAIAYPVYLLRRIFALRRRGYFVRHSRRHPVIYEEKSADGVVAVPIHTKGFEPGRNDVIVPTRAEWLRTAPEWAKERRDEIFKRIIEARPKGWAVLPDDWMV